MLEVTEPHQRDDKEVTPPSVETQQRERIIVI